MPPVDIFKLYRRCLAPSTLREYNGDLQGFLDYCQETGRDTSDWGEIDVILTAYFVHMHTKNQGTDPRAPECSKRSNSMLQNSMTDLLYRTNL